MDYREAWDMQNRLAQQIAVGAHPQTLLLLEHPHTYTIGRRGGQDHVLWDDQTRTKAGVTLVETDRGGDITYHGPGQLVGYPLLRLARPGWQGGRLPQADFVGYLRRLEEVIIQTLQAFSIRAVRRPGLTGVWIPSTVEDVAPAKIASIGVKIDAAGVSRHGFALNVAPQMEYWQGIIPCGIDGVRMTSMADFLAPPPMAEVVGKLTAAFSRVFDFNIPF
jgi:lipoate-protein ligase B